MEAQLAGQASDLQEKHDALGSLGQQLRQAAEEVARCHALLEQQGGQLEVLKGRSAALVSTRDQLEARLMLETDAREGQEAAHRRIVEAQGARIADGEGARQRLEQRLAQQTRDLLSREGPVEALGEQVQSLGREVRRLEAAGATSRQAIEDLEAELAGSQRAVAGLVATRQGLEEVAAQRQRDLERLQGETATKDRRIADGASDLEQAVHE